MRRKSLLVIALLAVLLLAALACRPRRADLRAFDSAGMAQLETAMWRDYYEKRYPALYWWQARREAVGPRDYGRTIAEVAALTYGKSPDDPAIAASGVARAEAMAYRDARREGMTERDWAEIERQLLRAYKLLKAGIGGS
jgi:hypothetical protein